MSRWDALLAELRRLREEASPGPWIVGGADDIVEARKLLSSEGAITTEEYGRERACVAVFYDELFGRPSIDARLAAPAHAYAECVEALIYAIAEEGELVMSGTEPEWMTEAEAALTQVEALLLGEADG